MIRNQCLAFGLIVAAACGASGSAGADAFVVKRLPPEPKDVLAAMMALSSEPLTHESCKSAGTELTDDTVGRYLAGFLAELSRQEDANALTTDVAEVEDSGYRAQVMIRHAAGEEIWSWGIEFVIRAPSGTLDRTSIRCLGGG